MTERAERDWAVYGQKAPKIGACGQLFLFPSLYGGWLNALAERIWPVYGPSMFKKFSPLYACPRLAETSGNSQNQYTNLGASTKVD